MWVPVPFKTSSAHKERQLSDNDSLKKQYNCLAKNVYIPFENKKKGKCSIISLIWNG